MKNEIIQKLNTYGIEHSINENKVKIKLNFNLEVNLVFNKNKTYSVFCIINRWNFISGAIKINLKSALKINSFGLIILTILLMYLDKTSNAFNVTLLFTSVCFLFTIWILYYNIIFENFKSNLMRWLDK